MKTFHMRKDRVSNISQLRAILVGASALLVLVSICAFPLPAMVKDARLERSIRALEEKRIELESLEEDLADLKSTLPSELISLIRNIHTALPRVDSVLTLRDLILALANLVGVEIHTCPVSSDPALLGVKIPGPRGRIEALGRVGMELRGTASLDQIFRLVELIEAARCAFVLDDLNISTSSYGDGRFDVYLGLKALFRADPDQLIETLTEQKDVR